MVDYVTNLAEKLWELNRLLNSSLSNNAKFLLKDRLKKFCKVHIAEFEGESLSIEQRAKIHPAIIAVNKSLVKLGVPQYRKYFVKLAAELYRPDATSKALAGLAKEIKTEIIKELETIQEWDAPLKKAIVLYNLDIRPMYYESAALNAVLNFWKDAFRIILQEIGSHLLKEGKTEEFERFNNAIRNVLSNLFNQTYGIPYQVRRFSDLKLEKAPCMELSNESKAEIMRAVERMKAELLRGGKINEDRIIAAKPNLDRIFEGRGDYDMNLVRLIHGIFRAASTQEEKLIRLVFEELLSAFNKQHKEIIFGLKGIGSVK